MTWKKQRDTLDSFQHTALPHNSSFSYFEARLYAHMFRVRLSWLCEVHSLWRSVSMLSGAQSSTKAWMSGFLERDCNMVCQSVVEECPTREVGVVFARAWCKSSLDVPQDFLKHHKHRKRYFFFFVQRCCLHSKCQLTRSVWPCETWECPGRCQRRFMRSCCRLNLLNPWVTAWVLALVWKHVTQCYTSPPVKRKSVAPVFREEILSKTL